MHAPARYEVRGHVGRRIEPLHRYTRERDAEQVARLILREGYSLRDSRHYDGASVYDRVTRTVIVEQTAPKRRYG